MTNRIHAHHPSTGTSTLEHTTNSAPTTHANGTHGSHRTSSSRGPDVIADAGSQTNAHTRLRAMQQRAGVSGTAPSGGSAQTNGFEAMVRDYRNQLVAGRVPTAPSAPALPHMSGREIIEHVGLQHPDFQRALREAEHARHENRPFGIAEHAMTALAHLGGHHGVDAEIRGAAAELMIHGGAEMLEIGTEMIAEDLGFHAAAAGATTLTTALAALAIVDATSMATQEIVNAARGRFQPTAAVLDGLRAEIPRRAATWMRDQSARAEASFSAGARRAAQGLSPETARLGDRAYMLGFEKGREYRSTHGDAYTRVVQSNRAMEQARREVAEMPHTAPAATSPATVTAHAAPAEHFVPVTQLEPDHVGVDFHIDG
jgi:hypothetical protein